MKFKPGMKVKLIGHSIDSDANLEVGVKGVVTKINYNQDQQVKVDWEESKISDAWWVTDDIIRPVNFQLENK